MSEILERIRKRDLPEHAYEAIVKGIVPMEADVLIQAIFLICKDDDSLLEAARESFLGMPDGIKKSFFEPRDRDPDIIDFYLRNFEFPLDAKSVILLNPSTKPKTLLAIAADLEDRLIDLVVNNQVKIQAEPGIVAALRDNPFLSINQKQKLDEYERLLLSAKVDKAEELEQKTIKEIEEEAIKSAKDYVKTFGKETGGPVRNAKAPPTTAKKAAEPEVVDEAASAVVGAEAAPAGQGQSGEPERISVLEQIAAMSIPQKVQAAIKGDREVRSILIRDANKLVCSAVIKSPRITDAEVEFYANMRNVQTDVLRLIAMNREWTKSYGVIHNLIKNPRTPLTYSMKFLSRLNKRDLKMLQRDRGVPEVLRKMAKKKERGG